MGYLVRVVLPIIKTADVSNPQGVDFPKSVEWMSDYICSFFMQLRMQGYRVIGAIFWIRTGSNGPSFFLLVGTFH
jgi:hypothetical protein